ncbi:hypothetical protein [Kribbella sp. NPDC050469]|uniref:hypothetical protein n=1 Tax=Kribbella sp. NPDC050469 TaxID=3364116 RepID=UPI0037B2B421
MPFWVLMGAGVVIGVMVLAKWTSVVVIGLIVIAAVIVLTGQGWRAVARGIGLSLAGLALTALVVQLFVVRLNVAVPGIMAVNRFIAETSYSPTALLEVYWSTGLELLGKTLREHAVLLAAAAVAVIGRWRWLRIAAGVLVALGFILSVRRVVVDDAAVGGSAHTSDYTVTLLAAVLVGLVTAVAAVLAGRYGLTRRSTLSREKARGWVVLGLLVVLPMVQAFGTNNPLYTIGFNAFASWVAVMIAVLTGIWTVPVVARVTVGLVTVASIVAVASISYSGMFLHPYRSVGHAELTEPAALEPLKGLYLQPSAAQNYAALEAELRPYLQPSGRPILAFDKMAGLVLLLQGKPVGEAWVAPKERNRTAAGIEEVCRDGQPWSPGRPPVILLNRAISDVEITALRACALDFTADYELLAPKQKTMNLQVYVPRAERDTKTP